MMTTDRPDTKTTDRLVITELFNAFVAFLFAASAPVAIILSVALGGGGVLKGMVYQRRDKMMGLGGNYLVLSPSLKKIVRDRVINLLRPCKNCII